MYCNSKLYEKQPRPQNEVVQKKKKQTVEIQQSVFFLFEKHEKQQNVWAYEHWDGLIQLADEADNKWRFSIIIYCQLESGSESYSNLKS